MSVEAIICVRALHQTRSDLSLTPTERLLLLSLALYADADARAWPSRKRLQAETGCRRETLQRALSRLEAAGLLSQQQDPRRGRTVFRLHLPPATAVADRSKCDEISQKCDEISHGCDEISQKCDEISHGNIRKTKKGLKTTRADPPGGPPKPPGGSASGQDQDPDSRITSSPPPQPVESAAALEDQHLPSAVGRASNYSAPADPERVLAPDEAKERLEEILASLRKGKG